MLSNLIARPLIQDHSVKIIPPLDLASEAPLPANYEARFINKPRLQHAMLNLIQTKSYPVEINLEILCIIKNQMDSVKISNAFKHFNEYEISKPLTNPDKRRIISREVNLSTILTECKEKYDKISSMHCFENLIAFLRILELTIREKSPLKFSSSDFILASLCKNLTKFKVLLNKNKNDNNGSIQEFLDEFQNFAKLSLEDLSNLIKEKPSNSRNIQAISMKCINLKNNLFNKINSISNEDLYASDLFKTKEDLIDTLELYFVFHKIIETLRSTIDSSHKDALRPTFVKENIACLEQTVIYFTFKLARLTTKNLGKLLDDILKATKQGNLNSNELHLSNCLVQ